MNVVIEYSNTILRVSGEVVEFQVGDIILYYQKKDRWIVVIDGDVGISLTQRKCSYSDFIKFINEVNYHHSGKIGNWLKVI